MKPNTASHYGEAAAAILAAGIGLCGFGVVVCASESSPAFAKAITLYQPTGPLSGKVAIGMAVWIVAWAVLASLWRGKAVGLKTAFRVSLALIAVGLVLTFPPVFDAIAAH